MRTLRTLLAAAFVSTLFLVLVPARAAGDDATAIAGVLSIGFANSDSNFSTIQTGSEFGSGSYQASKWPDKTHFQWCYVRHLTPGPAFGYECKSTPRTESQNALFKMAAAAVRANLPSGYATTGAETVDLGDGSGSIQKWTQSGKPTVVLLTATENGKSTYDLSVVTHPQ